MWIYLTGGNWKIHFFIFERTSFRFDPVSQSDCIELCVVNLERRWISEILLDEKILILSFGLVTLHRYFIEYYSKSHRVAILMEVRVRFKIPYCNKWAKAVVNKANFFQMSMIPKFELK